MHLQKEKIGDVISLSHPSSIMRFWRSGGDAGKTLYGNPVAISSTTPSAPHKTESPDHGIRAFCLFWQGHWWQIL